MADERLAAILGACVEARMRGRALDVQCLCRTHPDLAAAIREHLALLDLMDLVLGGTPSEGSGDPSRRIGGNDPRDEEAGMGWGRMFFLGNIGQQLDIEEQREEMRKLRREVRRARRGGGEGVAALEERVGRLERENDELRLYLAALIRHLGRRRALDPTELARVVAEIDAEDGAADGRYEGPISG